MKARDFNCRFYLLLLNIYYPFFLQVDHLTRHQEESERALQERILKLEGQRIQLEEVDKIIPKTILKIN